MRTAICFFAIALLLTGCGGVMEREDTIDTASPFRSRAVIWVGEREYEASLAYDSDGVLTVEIAPGTLSMPLRQTAGPGGTEVTLGERKLSYPAQWASTTSVAQLARSSLAAMKNVSRGDGVLRGDGTALGVPFVIEADEEGNILLSLAFPTLSVKIELSDFVREH